MLKKISELTGTTELDDNSLFVVVYNGETLKITKEDLISILNDDFVKNTDYATSSTGGVILAEKNGFAVVNGSPAGATYNYDLYQQWANSLFISKGTLENVLTARIGDIATLLDTINGEVI